MHTVNMPTNTKKHIQWFTYKTVLDFTVYSYSKKNKDKQTSKKNLCCILSPVSVWPQNLIHITSHVLSPANKWEKYLLAGASTA